MPFQTFLWNKFPQMPLMSLMWENQKLSCFKTKTMIAKCSVVTEGNCSLQALHRDPLWSKCLVGRFQASIETWSCTCSLCGHTPVSQNIMSQSHVREIASVILLKCNALQGNADIQVHHPPKHHCRDTFWWQRLLLQDNASSYSARAEVEKSVTAKYKDVNFPTWKSTTWQRVKEMSVFTPTSMGQAVQCGCV